MELAAERERAERRILTALQQRRCDCGGGRRERDACQDDEPGSLHLRRTTSAQRVLNVSTVHPSCDHGTQAPGVPRYGRRRRSARRLRGGRAVRPPRLRRQLPLVPRFRAAARAGDRQAAGHVCTGCSFRAPPSAGGGRRRTSTSRRGTRSTRGAAIPSSTCSTASPAGPLAFLQTVQMGVVDDTLAARHRAQPLILVMPFGSTGTFTDEEWVNGVSPKDGWATFVARDLVHYVDAHFRTIARARGRAIGGLSEGGYGAIDIALHHPREFSVVESWSGYQRPDRLRAIFGSKLQLLAAERPAPAPAARRARAAEARHVSSGSTRARPIRSAVRTRPSRASSPPRAPASLLPGLRRPQLGALARQRARRRPRRGDEARSWLGSPSRRGIRARARRSRRRDRLALRRPARRRAAGPGRARRPRARRAVAPRQRPAAALPRRLGGGRRSCSALLARWARRGAADRRPPARPRRRRLALRA